MDSYAEGASTQHLVYLPLQHFVLADTFGVEGVLVGDGFGFLSRASFDHDDADGAIRRGAGEEDVTSAVLLVLVGEVLIKVGPTILFAGWPAQNEISHMRAPSRK